MMEAVSTSETSAEHHRRQSTSYSSPLEPEMSYGDFIFHFKSRTLKLCKLTLLRMEVPSHETCQPEWKSNEAATSKNEVMLK
jgi:hypothetical protein